MYVYLEKESSMEQDNMADIAYVTKQLKQHLNRLQLICLHSLILETLNFDLPS